MWESDGMSTSVSSLGMPYRDHLLQPFAPNVYGGSEVSIVGSLATFARPYAVAECQRVIDRAANRTRLRGRIPPTDRRDGLAMPHTLVFEHPPKPTHARIADALGQFG